MRADSDIHSGAIVAFVLAVLGLVGAGGVLTAAANAAAGQDDVVDITYAVIGAFVAAAFLPVAGGLLAEAAKTRIARARRSYSGHGLAVAAQVLSVLALLSLVGSAALLVTTTEVELGGDDTAGTSDTLPVVFGEGTHGVPGEMRPGFYRADGGPDCYWMRLASLQTEGGDGDLIADGTDPFVHIAPSDAAFYSEGCGLWRGG